MKKIIKISILLLLISGCTNKENIINTPKKENTITKDNNPKENIYVDDNETTIGFYLTDSNYQYRNLVTSHNCNWIQYTDIVVFEVIPTHEEKISNEYIQTLLPKYWTLDKYKIGYYISFKTKDGHEFKQTILSPNDGKWFFDYIQIYLYDDYHQDIGAWYSHIEDKDVTDNTIYTSIKLTASTKIEDIESPIKLTVFTYDSDDFDENNNYRGKSKYEIDINKLNS